MGDCFRISLPPFYPSPWTAWSSSSRPCHFSISDSLVSVPSHISVGSYLRIRIHEWGFDDNDRDEAFWRTCTINYVFLRNTNEDSLNRLGFLINSSPISGMV